MAVPPRLVESKLDQGDARAVRSLLNDDTYLLETVSRHRNLCQDSTKSMLDSIDVLREASSCLNRPSLLRSELYIKAVAGELGEDTLIRELLLTVRKMSSDRLAALLEKLRSLNLQSAPLEGLPQIWDTLDKLTKSQDATDEPLRSEHDLRHETLRTTVVAQKVEISKQRTALSERDAAYSKLVRQTHRLLESYFADNLMDVRTLFLDEIYFYDFKSPLRDVFAPRPRHSLERALATPHDYLGCSCCKPSTEGLSSTQPGTAILYQLYLESGALINAFDLWSAFYAIVGGDDGEDCDEANAL